MRDASRSSQDSKATESNGSWSLDALSVLSRRKKSSQSTQDTKQTGGASVSAQSLDAMDLQTGTAGRMAQSWQAAIPNEYGVRQITYSEGLLPQPPFQVMKDATRSTRTGSLAFIPGEDADASDTDSQSDTSSEMKLILLPYQELIFKTMRDRGIHVVHSWESHGKVEVPPRSVAVCITTRIPSENDAQDLVEGMVSQKLSIPLIVLMVRNTRTARHQAQPLQVEMSRFLELGAADVVLQPMAEDPEDCVEAWLARANARAAQAAQLKKKDDKLDQEVESVINMAAEREDNLFWAQSHVLFEGLPKLNLGLQEPAVDRVLGSNHKVLELMNGGAFSDVYLVSDAKRQLRAMKAVSKERLDCFDLVKCISNEIQILRRLRHSNVVRFHGSAQSREHIIFLLEFAGRKNLFNFIKTQDSQDNGLNGMPLSTKVAQDFMRQMLSALAYCHGEGVSHRDIKPENFAISDDLTTVKLIDFGMSSELAAPLTHKGTMPFIAPEVIENDQVLYDSAAADIWSLGVVLIELVCGLHTLSKMLKWKTTMAAEKAHAADLRQLFAVPSKFRSSLEGQFRKSVPPSSALYDLILGMLSLDPRTRWAARSCLLSFWLPSQPTKQA